MTDVNEKGVRRVIELDFVEKKMTSVSEKRELQPIETISSSYVESNGVLYKDKLYLLLKDERGNIKLKIIDID